MNFDGKIEVNRVFLYVTGDIATWNGGPIPIHLATLQRKRAACAGLGDILLGAAQPIFVHRARAGAGIWGAEVAVQGKTALVE